jgi:diadenosine tetraphosphate (Ap4A) HIT family hydrolase
MKCPFCYDQEKGRFNDVDLGKRIFFKDEKWFAFLAAPAYTKGHSILALLTDDSFRCHKIIFDGMSAALEIVTNALQSCFNPKDILFASLRGNIKHFHIHMLPLWQEDEIRWRKEKVYEKGHLFEYMGDLEKKGVTNSILERIEFGLSEKEQREKIAEQLEPSVKELCDITGYQSKA